MVVRLKTRKPRGGLFVSYTRVSRNAVAHSNQRRYAIGPLHIYVMRDVKWTQWGLRNTNLAKHSMKVEGYRLLFCLECLLSQCCVPGCSSDGTFQKGLAFHEFPTEKSLRKSWIHAIRRDVGPHFQIVRGSTKICSLDFREEDYRKPCARTLARRKQKQKDGADCMESSSHRHILAPGVVPSVFPSFPERPAKRARPPPRERPQPAVAPADFTNDEDSESTDMVDTKQLGDDMDTIQGASAFSVESDLAAQVAALQEQLQAVLMRNQELEEHVFSAERILEDTSLLQFYTGFQSKAMFLACFNFFETVCIVHADVVRSIIKFGR